MGSRGADKIDREFGPTVRSLRLDADMSQEELAMRLSERGLRLSQAVIGKIERGERKVTVGEADSIANALGSSLSEILMGASYVTSQILRERLHTLRDELIQAMRNFESGQAIAAMEAQSLDQVDFLLTSLILESTEEVLQSYRKDKIAENTSRQHRDSLDSDGESQDSPTPAFDSGGIFDQWAAKFGDQVELVPQPHALATIINRQLPAEPPNADG